MVVDDAAGLKVEIDRDWAKILETPPAEVGADGFRQAVQRRDQSLAVPVAEACLAVREAPDVLRERGDVLTGDSSARMTDCASL